MILVTGAGGTVGSELVRQLQAAGVPFRAAYNHAEKAKAAKTKGIDAVVIDFNRPETLRDALRGIDKMFLLLGGAPDQTQLELNAVNAAKAAGVKHIVKLSVWGAEGEQFSFAKIHRPVEKAIEQSGMAWTFLRPNGFMQNMANYNAGSIKSQGAFYGSIGDAKISHVHVKDIAAVALKALTEAGHERKAYTLSGPEALSYSEVAEKLSKAAGREVKYVNLSDEQLKGGMVGAGVPAPYADALIDLNRYYRGNTASEVTSDVKKVTGRDPIRFDQYARENKDAFRN
ncbi:MAG TPA: SDR family oxidoreductase [Thermoanaerobaculia bacterium]